MRDLFSSLLLLCHTAGAGSVLPRRQVARKVLQVAAEDQPERDFERKRPQLAHSSPPRHRRAHHKVPFGAIFIVNNRKIYEGY